MVMEIAQCRRSELMSEVEAMKTVMWKTVLEIVYGSTKYEKSDVNLQ